jgi:transposase
MPLRAISREQGWLLPPSMDELVGADHPARFVAAFVDELDGAVLRGLGVPVTGAALGAPAYPPRLLLSVWLYGFLRGVRSSRKLEVACQEHLPFLWLSGGSHPDHNTLWRFYQAHRQQMRLLLKRTVRTAVKLGLVDLALQAVDGTKVQGNAAKDRTYDAADLRALLERTEAAIRDLEAQNATGGDSPPPSLPPSLHQKKELHQQVAEALERITQEDSPARINLTDPEAVLLKSRQGYVVGYNGQAVVSPLLPDVAGVGGLLISAAEVTVDPDDHRQLIPMIERAHENLGEAVAVTLADAGYHSGENLAACEQAGLAVVMPEAHAEERLADPYHKDAFVYAADTDSSTCPQGKILSFRYEKHRTGRPPARIYRAVGRLCRACPVFGVCTKNRKGRSLEVGPHERELRTHRRLRQEARNQDLYRRRKELPEPTFGIIKEQLGGRRFLLRGTANVAAEWSLLATAFNLRTLIRVWQQRSHPPATRFREARVA